jgi:hypothetical protein
MALRNESFILGPLGSGAVRLWSARVFALSFRFFAYTNSYLLCILWGRYGSRLNHGGESRFTAGRIPLKP